MATAVVCESAKWILCSGHRRRKSPFIAQSEGVGVIVPVKKIGKKVLNFRIKEAFRKKKTFRKVFKATLTF